MPLFLSHLAVTISRTMFGLYCIRCYVFNSSPPPKQNMILYAIRRIQRYFLFDYRSKFLRNIPVTFIFLTLWGLFLENH